MRRHTALELWRLGGVAYARSKTAGSVYTIRQHRRVRMLALVEQYGRRR